MKPPPAQETGAKKEEDAALEYFNRGIELYDHDDFTGAVKMYKAALECIPNYVDAWYELSFAQWRLNDFQATVKSAESAVAIDPEDHRSWSMIGAAKRSLKDYDGAIKAFQQSAKLKPFDARISLNIGTVRKDLKDLAGAAKDYERSIQKDPNLLQGWTYLAEARRDLDDAPGAIRAFRRALRLDPKCIDGWISLGKLLKKQGDPGSALYCFSQAAILGDAEAKQTVEEYKAKGVEMADYSIEKPPRFTTSSLAEFATQQLLDVLARGTVEEKARAALLLGAIHAGNSGKKPEVAGLLKKNLELTGNEEVSILKTMATIGLGFVNKGGGDLDLLTATGGEIIEGKAVAAGLGAIKDPERQLEAALNDDRGNVVFGGAIGACLHILTRGPVKSGIIKQKLASAMKMEQYDVHSAALLATGLQAMASGAGSAINTTALESSTAYEVRMATILADCFSLARAKDKDAAMNHLQMYMKGTGFDVMAAIPSCALLLLSEDAPITQARYDKTELKLEAGGSIYETNAALLAFAFMATHAEGKFKAFIADKLQRMGGIEDVQHFADVNLVYSVCLAMIAGISEKPMKAFLELVNRVFAPAIGIDEPGLNESRKATGALLGIAMALFLTRAAFNPSVDGSRSGELLWTKKGLDNDVLKAIAPLLNQGLHGTNMMQKATTIAMAAGTLDAPSFEQFLFVFAAYEMACGGDYPYLKAELLILTAFVIFYNRLSIGTK